MRTITLASAIDFDGFRHACRALWAEQVEPGEHHHRADRHGRTRQQFGHA